MMKRQNRTKFYDLEDRLMKKMLVDPTEKKLERALLDHYEHNPMKSYYYKKLAAMDKMEAREAKDGSSFVSTLETVVEPSSKTFSPSIPKKRSENKAPPPPIPTGNPNVENSQKQVVKVTPMFTGFSAPVDIPQNRDDNKTSAPSLPSEARPTENPNPPLPQVLPVNAGTDRPPNKTPAPPIRTEGRPKENESDLDWNIPVIIDWTLREEEDNLETLFSKTIATKQLIKLRDVNISDDIGLSKEEIFKKFKSEGLVPLIERLEDGSVWFGDNSLGDYWYSPFHPGFHRKILKDYVDELEGVY